jgi:hypothetical protein
VRRSAAAFDLQASVLADQGAFGDRGDLYLSCYA